MPVLLIRKRRNCGCAGNHTFLPKYGVYPCKNIYRKSIYIAYFSVVKTKSFREASVKVP